MSDDPLSLRQLEVFVALIEQGSFTRAARFLELSQSTVSSHVADLERRLGVRLVERNRGGVRPTGPGQALLAPARDALEAEARAREAVGEVGGVLRGRLIVGASTIPASYLVPRLLSAFHRLHPEVRLRLVAGDSREIVEQVRRGAVEVGVVGAAAKRKGLRCEPVGEDRLVLVAPPGHPVAGKRSVSAREVLRHPLVMREEGSGTRAATLEALSGALGQAAVAHLLPVCEVGSTEALKAAVREGLGVGFLSELAVAGELESGRLVAVNVRKVDLRRRFFLITPPEARAAPAARAFRGLALSRESSKHP